MDTHELTETPMSKRRLGVLTLVLAVLLAALAAPAAAVEGEDGGHGQEDLEMEEIGTGSETAKEFRPEPFEQPAFFKWIIYPLAGLGVLAALVILGLYLLWQPEFGREGQEKKR